MIPKSTLTIALTLGALWMPYAVPASSSQPAPAVTFRYAEAARDSGAAAHVLRVHVEIAPGWHINSDAPLDEFLVPTTVEAKAEGIVFGKPRFPRPERVHSEAFGSEVLLLSGAFDIEIPAGGMPAAAGKGSVKVPRTSVTLRYQACDHATCYAPKETTVEH